MSIRFLISLGTLGVAAGTGAGVYYGVLKKDTVESPKEQKEKFSGSLIFEKVKKEGDDSKDVYKAKIDTSTPTNLDEGKECKFADDKLTCKVSDKDKEKIDKYTSDLNSALAIAVGTSETLKGEFKKELKKQDQKLNENFGSSFYTSIEEALQ